MNLKKGKFLGAILLSVFFLSSCKSLKNTNTLFQSEYDKFADTAKSVFVANTSQQNSNYKIRPFDLIAIRNLQNPEGLVTTTTTEGVLNAAVFRSDKNATIILPVIGTVKLNELTLSEATAKVQDLYSKHLFKDPIIELTIVNNKVTLLGESAKPGNYQLERENVDLIELIGKSGGLMASADARKIKIIRGDRKNPEVIYINLKNSKSLASDKLILQNNDIIYIPPNKLNNISEGLKSYSTIIQPALLLLNALIIIRTLN